MHPVIRNDRQRIEDLACENGRRAAELERAASAVVALSKENDALRAAQALPAWRSAPWWLWGVGP